jgi:hypothetical protein
MRKNLLFKICMIIILLSLGIIWACRKTDNLNLREALIVWKGDPAADGLGWTISLTNDHFEIPTNLPRQYMIDSLPVSVSFEASSKKFYCMCAQPISMVEIVSIKRR